jgi:hypothetical protein
MFIARVEKLIIDTLPPLPVVEKREVFSCHYNISIKRAETSVPCVRVTYRLVSKVRFLHNTSNFGGFLSVFESQHTGLLFVFIR